MSDFKAYEEDIEAGMEYLEHFGILGQKHGQRNGPPYPLGSGDHSSAEKKAASAAGVKVGSDSGKGSIDNVKKKKKKAPVKKELTPEEKREAALEASRTGDKKKISKYMDQLSTDELRDAQNRAMMRDTLTRKDPSEQKMSKADVEKMEAMRSGDKERIKEYASQMSNQELREAMDRVNLNAELNKVIPPPTAMDKLKKFSENVDNFRQVAERGVNAYNLAAKVYNSTHKDGTKWPIIGEKPKEESQEDKMAKALAKAMGKDVMKNAKEAKQENDSKKKESDNKDYQKSVDKANAKAAKAQAKLEEQKAKYDLKSLKEQRKAEREAEKESNKTSDDHEYIKKIGEGEDAEYIYKEDTQPKEHKYSSERAPSISSSHFNNFESTAKKKMSDYDDVSYDDIMDSYKDTMRTSMSKASARQKALGDEWDDYYDAIYDYMSRG